jgi:hypothetical protein
MIYLHIKFHTSKGSLIITNTMKAKKYFCIATMLLLYILQKHSRKLHLSEIY